MKRKLSAIECMIDGNIVYMVRLEGSFQVDRLREALARVQRKHPALRMVLRKQKDGLYYEENCAPDVPLRIVPRIAEDDYKRESLTELGTAFVEDRSLLRAVWLPAETESDLLLVTSHRICDGMSMLTIVREVLFALHSDQELVPYEPITAKVMIGDYEPPQPWKRKLIASLLNNALRLLPASRRPLENKEYALEWGVGQALTDALKQRCKAEGVSIHAALVIALDRALLQVLGEKKLPGWIESPMDARRGRLASLKSDMLFFGGGSLKMRTGQASEEEFWTKGRSVHEEIRRMIDQEMEAIPGRYSFNELLRPVPHGRIQTMVQLGDALKVNGSWNRMALSNLGNVAVSDSSAPFRVKDLRLYVHSFNFRLLGIVAYAFNGEMRFYYVGDEKCLSVEQANALKNEFMTQLQRQVAPLQEAAKEVLHMAGTTA
ncbi:condensation domain-containing protein [Granulicella mallensis]|uniref:Condensation domain protein n=1 Tax=Granulicella mallensis (strain ATCC BAA-1857 / DSM 23137 / MP5ACTX8) TaxID=682795 RepID=G8NQ05_GRAMM|nr:condensation domain-containing protein [Granulicella mallensis]AEU38339.1 condensation domain protein [Granulicella mallensis MP5ACTX8]